MAWGIGEPAPKPEKKSREKARRQRHAAKVVKSVRQLCVERDGYCRIGRSTKSLGVCLGISEWAHVGDYKRFRTRGMDSYERHTTRGSVMLCARHHISYDTHAFEILARTDRGCDGPLEFKSGRVQVFEIESRNDGESA